VNLNFEEFYASAFMRAMAEKRTVVLFFAIVPERHRTACCRRDKP